MSFLMIRRRWAQALAVIVILAGTRATAATWDAEIAPKPGDNFIEAKFRLRLDELGGLVKGLLVLSPGWNGDGRGLVDDAGWRQFARQAGFGIVGVCLRSGSDKESVYHIVDQGSGDAFCRALVELAKSSRHPEVSNAPLLAWGHSAGGQFSYGLACFMPERVIAFAAVKGGIYQTRFNPMALKIPGIFMIGAKDEPWRLASITQIFESGRQSGAVWCVAWEANSGHEIGRSREVIEPFFKDTLALRMTGGKLRDVAPAKGWVGVRATLEIKPPGAPCVLDPMRTAWLPGERSAKAWAGFEK